MIRLNDDIRKSLEEFYQNKIKEHQKMVQEEYDFWQRIDSMADGEDENMKKQNALIKKMNNGGYGSNYNPFTHYPPEIKEKLKKIRQKKD